MITKQDLQAAIAECQGVRNPNASTCLKLAAYYTIQDKMYGRDDEAPVEYSYATSPASQIEKGIDYMSDTEFSQAIHGKQENDIWPIIDELMSVLQAINPRLYDGVMRKIDA